VTGEGEKVVGEGEAKEGEKVEGEAKASKVEDQEPALGTPLLSALLFVLASASSALTSAGSAHSSAAVRIL
jgi:hypothetical protein